MAETHAQMLQIQFVKQPLLMVNFSGYKRVGYGSHLVFQTIVFVNL